MIVEKLREIENEGSLDEAGWEEFQQELELTDSALDLAKVGVGAIHYIQSLPPSTLFLSPIPSCLPPPPHVSIETSLALRACSTCPFLLCSRPHLCPRLFRLAVRRRARIVAQPTPSGTSWFTCSRLTARKERCPFIQS